LKTGDRPTLIVVNSHIGWGSPHKQDSHTAHGEPLGEEEVRLTKRITAGPRMQNSVSPTACTNIFSPASESEGKELRGTWSARFDSIQDEISRLADEISRMESRQLPDGWDKDFHHFPPMRRSGTARLLGKVEKLRSPRTFLVFCGSRTSRRSTKTLLSGVADFEAGNYADEICTSASASTPWPRSSMA